MRSVFTDGRLTNKSRAYKVTAFCVQTVCGPHAHKVGTQNGATQALEFLEGTSRAWSRKDVGCYTPKDE